MSTEDISWLDVPEPDPTPQEPELTDDELKLKATKLRRQLQECIDPFARRQLRKGREGLRQILRFATAANAILGQLSTLESAEDAERLNLELGGRISNGRLQPASQTPSSPSQQEPVIGIEIESMLMGLYKLLGVNVEDYTLEDMIRYRDRLYEVADTNGRSPDSMRALVSEVVVNFKRLYPELELSTKGEGNNPFTRFKTGMVIAPDTKHAIGQRIWHFLEDIADGRLPENPFWREIEAEEAERRSNDRRDTRNRRPDDYYDDHRDRDLPVRDGHRGSDSDRRYVPSPNSRDHRSSIPTRGESDYRDESEGNRVRPPRGEEYPVGDDYDGTGLRGNMRRPDPEPVTQVFAPPRSEQPRDRASEPPRRSGSNNRGDGLPAPRRSPQGRQGRPEAQPRQGAPRRGDNPHR